MDHGRIKPPIGICQIEMLSTNRITSLKLSSKYHGFTLMHIQSQNCILPISNRICAQNSYRVISNSPRVCMVGTRSRAVQGHLCTGATKWDPGTNVPWDLTPTTLSHRHARGYDLYSKIGFLTILVLIIEIFIFNFLMSSRALWSLFAYIFYPYLPTISFYKTYFL